MNTCKHCGYTELSEADTCPNCEGPMEQVETEYNSALAASRTLFELIKERMVAGEDTADLWTLYRAQREALKVPVSLFEVKVCTCKQLHTAATGIIAEDGHLSYECPSCGTSLVIKAGRYKRTQNISA